MRSRWTRSVPGGQAWVLAGRAGWNMADQVVSSGTNFALSILVARSVSADGFGHFAVAFTLYTFLYGAGRALIAQPIVVRYTTVGSEGFLAAGSAAAGAATLLGLGAGTVIGGVGFVTGGALGIALLCVGALLPGLLLQDMWRSLFVAQGRPSAALVNDVVWGVVQFAALAAVLRLGPRNAATMLLAWGGAALVAALVGILQFGARPRLRASLPWLHRQRDLLRYYGPAFLLMHTSQLTLLLISVLGAPSDVGAIRAAQVVLGPLLLLSASMSTFVTPEIARRGLRGPRAVQVAVVLAAGLVLVDVLWGAVVLTLPDRIGTELLGSTWASASEVLPATLLSVVALAAATGAHVVLYGLGYARETLLAAAAQAPLFLVLGLGGLQLWQAPGAALGIALAQCALVPIVWWQLLRLMRRGERPADRPQEERAPDGVL